MLLGVGWNFAFIGATALVTQCHRPNERNKVQAFNDFLVFGSMAIGSFSSGKLLHVAGWGAVNGWCSRPCWRRPPCWPGVSGSGAGVGPGGLASGPGRGRRVIHATLRQNRRGGRNRCVGRPFWQCPRRFGARQAAQCRAGSPIDRRPGRPAQSGQEEFHDSFGADHHLRLAGDCLRDLGDSVRAAGRRRQRQDAGDFRGRARRRAGLSQAPVHHHRHRRRRDLPDRRLFPRLAGRHRLRDRRGAVGRGRLHRHERLGARQRAHRPGGDLLARRRPRARLQVRRHHRPAGRRPRAARRHRLFRDPHRRPRLRAQ